MAAETATHATAFAGVWTLVNEGAVTVETRVLADRDSPLAIRTVLQLDGDCLLLVDLGVIGPLSPCGRLRLAVRHRRAVRARMAALTAQLSRDTAVLRHLPLVVFGGVELASLTHDLGAGLAFVSVWPLVAHQAACLAPLVVRRLLPYGLGLARRAAVRQFSAARRVHSRNAMAASFPDVHGATF